MTFLMRKCALTARNVNRFRKLYALVTIESHRPYCNNTRNLRSSIAAAHFRWRQFHTSQTDHKIVAFKLSDIGEGIREVVIKECCLKYSDIGSLWTAINEDRWDQRLNVPKYRGPSDLLMPLMVARLTPWVAYKHAFVKVGDKVQQFDNICEVQSDKAAVTITSRYDGVVKRLYHEVDQTALVGNPLVDIEVEDTGDDEALQDSSAEAVPAATPTPSSNQKVKILTTPAVRRIAAQFEVNLSTVKATGKSGRVLKEDVLAHLNMTSDRSNEVPDATVVTAASIPVIQAHAKTEVLLEDRTVPISGFTRAMVKSMTEAMKIPHFGLSEEYDVTKLVESRETLKTLAQEQGVRLTYLPIIIKAASLGLNSFPILNSSLDSSCEHITYKTSHNIGVAMDTPNGLVVPVIKNVQTKTILEIAKELNILQEKGKNGQLGLSDLGGGTFTLSNIGIIGGTYANPVIFPPQVAIGALGKIQVLPRFNSNGDVVKAHVLTVSWSADHRVIDGVTMARFSNHLKRYLENPSTLILDL